MLVIEKVVLIGVEHIERPAIDHTGHDRAVDIAQRLTLEGAPYFRLDVTLAKIADHPVVGEIVAMANQDHTFRH